MDVDRAAEADGPVDPVRAFAARLRRLQADSGGPSVRDLERLTGKVGRPYTRGTIQDKLTGRSAPTWEFVEAFVQACALHTGAAEHVGLRPWRAWHGQMLRELAARRAGRRRAAAVEVCPYRGLETFTAEHAEWFHGRAAAVQQVLAALAAHRQAVLVLGPSGAGKSSLMQAGVLPALAAGELPGSDQWLTVLARPGPDLLAELDLARLAGRAGQAESHRVLVVVDQFEEMLTPAASDDQVANQRHVIDRLIASIGTPEVSVIVIMRDDFYPRLAAQAPELLRMLNQGLVNVPTSLNKQDLHDIISKPADAVGLTFEDGLPERIVADMLAADPRAKEARQAPITLLPLLELTLRQLWQRREGGRLTHAAYQRIGGVSGALTVWCDTAMEQLTAEQQPMAQRLLTALVRPADDLHGIPAVRQQVPLVVLHNLADVTDPRRGPQPTDQTIDDVLAVLTTHRIVTTRSADLSDDAPTVPVAELVHEALIRDWAALRDWVGQDHRFQTWLYRAGEQYARWEEHRNPGDLLSGSDFAEGLEWSTRRRLPDATARLLAASRQHQRAGIRRARRLNAILATLLVGALTAAGLALVQRRNAVNSQQVALSRQLAAQSTSLIASAPELAALLAIQAYRTSPTAEAIGSIYAAAALPLLHRLTGQRYAVSSVAFSPDGSTLATGSADGLVQVWDPANGQARATLTGHEYAVLSMAFSPDGHTLATGSADNRVRLWDVASGQARRTLTGQGYVVSAVAFSPDGRTLTAGGADGTVVLWDEAGGQARGTVTGHTGPILSMAFSPDGRTLAAGAAGTPGAVLWPGPQVVTGGTVLLWDVASGQARAPLASHTDPVSAVAFSPDGRTLATGATDGTVLLWDVSSGQARGTVTGHTGPILSMAFSPDGRTLTTGSDDGSVRLWDAASGQARATLARYAWTTVRMAFSPDWHTWTTVRMAFSPDWHTLATGSSDGTVRLWAGGQARATLPAHTDTVSSVAFSPDGRTLATGSHDATVRLWDPVTGQARGTPASHPGGVFSIAFSPDGRTLATGGINGPVRLWDPASGQARGTVPGNQGLVNSIAFSPDGRILAVGSSANTVQLLDPADGRARTLFGHYGPVNSIAFSLDGRTLATGSDDKAVQLWDPASGQARGTLTGHTGPVFSVAFSPDGRTLATGSVERTVRLWDVASRRPRAVLTGHTGDVSSIAFSPDGRTLAAGASDGTLRLWDVTSRQGRGTLTGHTGPILSVAFSRDGRTVATGGTDHIVRLWDAVLPTPTAAIDKICRTVNRDLTAQERMIYLPPNQSRAAVCKQRR